MLAGRARAGRFLLGTRAGGAAALVPLSKDPHPLFLCPPPASSTAMNASTTLTVCAQILLVYFRRKAVRVRALTPSALRSTQEKDVTDSILRMRKVSLHLCDLALLTARHPAPAVPHQLCPRHTPVPPSQVQGTLFCHLPPKAGTKASKSLWLGQPAFAPQMSFVPCLCCPVAQATSCPDNR